MMTDRILQNSSGTASEKIFNSPGLPKFNLGDRVIWFRVPTQDFGVVSALFHGSEGSVQAVG
ncbi:hypothetical protein [Phormidesmis priestleyi]